MDGWDNYFVAQAGAAVAFAGLVLVSISINLERILKQSGLIGRSVEPLIVLFTLFVASSFVLLPDQPTWVYGAEILLLGIVFSLVMGMVLKKQRGLTAKFEDDGTMPKSSFLARLALAALTAAGLVTGGLLTALGHERGIFLLVPAMIAGFLLSFIDAWVLLIEIDR